MNRVSIIACLALATILVGCGEDIEPGQTKSEAAVVRDLSLHKVQAESVSRSGSYVGTVESRDRAALSARIDGRVAEIAVREGKEVKAGDLLMVLDDNQAADRLAEARSAVSEAERALFAARAGLSLAEKTYHRYAQLEANEAVTPQEMDEVEARLEQARQQVGQAEAARSRALSAMEAARMAVSWTRVRAPYAAHVVRHQVEVGSTVMPGTPLSTLDRKGKWQVRATIPASRTGRFTLGQELNVELPSRGLVLTGTVLEILPTADPQSRSFEIKISLEDGPDLAAGLFARVYAPAPEAPVILVPSEAVVERGQLKGLYVVEDGRLHYRLVRVGRRFDDRVEILSGLNRDETIVVDGVRRARHGARVEGG